MTKFAVDAIRSLTERECDVLNLVRQGYRNQEIAERLQISEWTVKNHMHNILIKLNARNRMEAVYLVRNILR